MTDVFRSPRLTLNRAKHHIADFNAVVRDFVNNSPWTGFIDKDSKPGHEIHKIRFVRELPENLPCILFDAANNLRAVLDQTGYAVAIASGKVAPKKTSFPFGEDLAGLNNNIEGRRSVCKDIPTEIVTLFRNFQPYKGPNNALWALNKLCNTKKHCALVPIDVRDARAHFIAHIPDGTLIDHSVGPNGIVRGWDAEKREMTLVTVPSGFDPNIHGHFTFQIAIEGIETTPGKPAVDVLNAMSGIVERILLCTEAECRRLGLIT